MTTSKRSTEQQDANAYPLAGLSIQQQRDLAHKVESAMKDLDSIRRLSRMAEDAEPMVRGPILDAIDALAARSGRALDFHADLLGAGAYTDWEDFPLPSDFVHIREEVSNG